MNTTIVINGGAGRVISAVPALEKYARLNPDDDFKVLVYGWESLFWSHPLLQNRTFSIGQKGVFEQFIKNNKVMCPEPYYVYGYYNQQLSLSEAFDEEINKTQDHTDLTPPKLYLSMVEQSSAATMIRQKFQEMKKSKVMVIQPFGSGMQIINNRPYDISQRSLDVDDYLKICQRLAGMNKDLLIIYFGPSEFRHPGDSTTIHIEQVPDLRMYLALIGQCNYFLGCDSVGQHMARALDKRGMVIMGATDEKNVSYPNHFRIWRDKTKTPVYSPIRLAGIDCEFADRMNDGIMRLTDDQIINITNVINRDLAER